MAAATEDGRTERTQSPTGRVRQPDLTKFYSRILPTLTPVAAEWELKLLRAHEPPLDIDSIVESFSWSDESSAMSGNLQCHRPIPDDPSTLPIRHAQRIRARVRWGGGSWYELWTMRTKPPQTQLDTNSVSIDLEDDLELLKGIKRDWSYRRTSSRNHGYTADEIALLVAQRIGMRVSKLAKGTHRIDKLVKRNSTPLDVIKTAYQAERKATGRKFVIRMRNGRLEVVPFSRNRTVYVMNTQIQAASLSDQPKSDRPFTALTGHGHLGKGKHAKKIVYTEKDDKAIRRLGYMHQDKNYGQVQSVADLHDHVHRDLADALRIDRTADLTHTGLPFVRRGDAVILDLPREGFSGKNAFAFVQTANHQVTGGAYTTDFTFTTADPYVSDLARQEKERKQRETARRKRASRHRGSHH